MIYLHPTQAAGKAFFLSEATGPVTMLNLLRFRETADYAEAPDLAPESPISGREAYRRYAAHILPLLKNAGSEVLYYGEGGKFLIGPEAEGWDAVLLVRHAGKEAFLAFADDHAYRSGAGHRTAALADSRLLPITETVLG